jgi:hypothetical protein
MKLASNRGELVELLKEVEVDYQRARGGQSDLESRSSEP